MMYKCNTIEMRDSIVMCIVLSKYNHNIFVSLFITIEIGICCINYRLPTDAQQKCDCLDTCLYFLINTQLCLKNLLKFNTKLKKKQKLNLDFFFLYTRSNDIIYAPVLVYVTQ